jgi:hypothetical protein
MSRTPSDPGTRDSDPRDEDEIARSILDYLRAHPQASDTLEGVAKWWLLRQRVSESTEVVQRVLTRLRDQGLIRERRLAGGGTLYEASGPEEGENRQGAKSTKKK